MFVYAIFLFHTVCAVSTKSLAVTTTNPVLTTTSPVTEEPMSRYDKGLEDYDEAMENLRKSRQGRGMVMDYEEDYHHGHKEKEMVEQKAVKTDPWAGYYDFVINEGSFKFWAAFQLGTALLLTYSAFAAVYYAKFNPVGGDYDYYDGGFFRSNGRSADIKSNSLFSSSWFNLDSQTIQRILNAITSKKYS